MNPSHPAHSLVSILTELSIMALVVMGYPKGEFVIYFSWPEQNEVCFQIF